MASFEAGLSAPPTLAQRLSEGRLPAPEAFGYALMLAELLRRLHEAGEVGGGLSPQDIAITAGGLKLNDATRQPGAITPYTAPETVQGSPADSRSDVFAFGALLYEMVTGRRAFDGPTPEALAKSLAEDIPPSSGVPAVDHLIGKCLAKNPASRYQRIQNAIPELNLLAVGVRRAHEERTRQSSVGALTKEVRQLEAGITARLEAHEQEVLEAQRATGQALGALQALVTESSAQIAASQERSAAAEQRLEALGQSVAQFETNGENLTRRIDAIEQELESLRQGASSLREDTAAQFDRIGKAIGTQDAAMESIRATQAQYDDLIERVIEALGVLQNMLDREMN